MGLKDNVFVQGRCSDSELYGLLKSSKVFVFPSLFEGWGIAVAEALTCGLSAVVYDIPALREKFGGCKSVFLVPAKDVKKLSDKIMEVLSLSNRELEKLASASRDFAGSFKWECVAEKDLEAIKSLFKK